LQDNNGYITPLELSKMMATLGHDMDAHQIVEMIREADVDNDGKISFAEFKKVMSS
jgi:Ca2+-binding EF-hand superfamily protein